MTPQGQPRVGQKIGDVMNEGGNLVAKMGLWLQQYLKSVGRNPTTTVTAQTVGASPYTYTNNGDFDMDAVVTGGTVGAVAFTRDGVFYPIATSGLIRLNPGDGIRITYTVLPALNLIPR